MRCVGTLGSWRPYLSVWSSFGILCFGRFSFWRFPARICEAVALHLWDCVEL